MPKLRLSTIFVLMALCTIGSCALLPLLHTDTVTYNATRENVWLSLPSDATKINLFEPGAFGPRAFLEFNTSEESFLKWVAGFSVERADYPPPYTIYRYGPYSPGADPSLEVEIYNGHLFTWSEEDRGLYIAYDKDTGRAFYRSHSR